MQNELIDLGQTLEITYDAPNIGLKDLSSVLTSIDSCLNAVALSILFPTNPSASYVSSSVTYRLTGIDPEESPGLVGGGFLDLTVPADANKLALSLAEIRRAIEIGLVPSGAMEGIQPREGARAVLKPTIVRDIEGRVSALVAEPSLEQLQVLQTCLVDVRKGSIILTLALMLIKSPHIHVALAKVGLPAMQNISNLTMQYLFNEAADRSIEGIKVFCSSFNKVPAGPPPPLLPSVKSPIDMILDILDRIPGPINLEFQSQNGEILRITKP